MQKIKYLVSCAIEGFRLCFVLTACMLFTLIILPIGLLINLIFDIKEAERNQQAYNVDFDKE